MANLRQQEIDTLIQFINDAEDPGTVTNVMVATILAYLADKINSAASASDLTQLQNTLNTLMSGDATEAIESFQEVISFLSGVTDDETLTGLLVAINTRLTSAETGLSGKASKDSDTGRLVYSQAPTIMLDSMGRDLDNANNPGPVVAYSPRAGHSVFAPTTGKIIYYKTASNYVSRDPDPGLIYGNKITGYLYQWKNNQMQQVGGSVNNLTSGGEDAALSAEMGKVLGNKTRVVIDEIDSEYSASSKPSAGDVPNAGLLCYNQTDGKLHYFYKVTENSTTTVECLSCDPDPKVIYCLAEDGANITLRWDTTDGWQQVGGSGGGVTVQHESGQCRIIFGAGGGGGANLNIPTVTAAWANSDKFSESNTSKVLNITWKNLEVGAEISIQGSTNYSCSSSITTDAASGTGTLTVASTATNDGTETIHVISGDIDVSVSCEFESIYAIRATDGETADDVSTNAALCAQLHSVGYTALDDTTKQTASADGVLKTEITDIKAFPADFANTANYSSIANAMKGTLDLRKFTALTSIGKKAFRGCKIKSLKLPAQAHTLGESAFNQYPLSSGVLNTLDLGGCTSIGKTCFQQTRINPVTIPASVQSIGDQAFGTSSNMGTVEFLNTENNNKPTIGGVAFESTSITTVTVHTSTPPTCSYASAWFGSNNPTGKTLNVPAGAISAYSAATGWSKFAATGNTIIEQSNAE